MPTKAISSFAQQQQPDISKSAKYRLWTNKVLPALILAACCWLAFTVTEKGLASAYYFKANHYLDLWQRKPETLDINSWQQAADAIETAVALHPGHPHYLLALAKTNEWAWYKGLKTADQIAVNDRLYKIAIELRPTWPNAYADYAYYLGIVNFRVSEAFAQLKKAETNGPYTPEVYLRTLQISARHWQILNGDQKVQGFNALTHMLKSSYDTYKQAAEISKGYKLTRPHCVYLRLKKEEFTQLTNKRINKDFCEA